MAFDLTIETKQGQFNWFDLPDSDRFDIEMIRDKFNLAQYAQGQRIRIEGWTTVFDEPVDDILSIRITG